SRSAEADRRRARDRAHRQREDGDRLRCRRLGRDPHRVPALRGGRALPRGRLFAALGFELLGRAEASLLFRLVSYRYGRGSILIPTNKGIKDWPEMLAGDEVLATAILDRLLHKSHVLNIKGRSYRLRDLEQAAVGRV